MMSDVYVGLTDIPRGTIKYLRVMEQIPRPWGARRFWGGDSYDQQHAVITKDTHLALKVMHGVIPVEEDGSAYFIVPAERNIFFQALDEDFMEIQRMRTYINLRQGETRSCIGCHELRQLAPGNKKSIAFQNPPRRPEAQPGDVAPRPIHYAKDVQPILDKHCVTCHNSSDPKANLDLSGEMTTLFNRSYESILDRKLVKTIGENHPKTGNVALVPPKALSSHSSKLVAQIKKGCPGNERKLSRTEFIKLVTWVDSNAQYYGSYYGRRNLQYKDHPNFRPVPTFENAVSTVAPLAKKDR
jgi:hypothetical protein